MEAFPNVVRRGFIQVGRKTIHSRTEITWKNETADTALHRKVSVLGERFYINNRSRAVPRERQSVSGWGERVDLAETVECLPAKGSKNITFTFLAEKEGSGFLVDRNVGVCTSGLWC